MTARYTVSTNPQGTEAWYADRCGNLNGSEADALYTVIKSGESAARRNLRLKMVLEGITGNPQERMFAPTKDMQWGIDNEHDNRKALEVATGLLIEQVGYCKLVGKRAGCSLDGRVDDEGRLGIVELKCPASNTHLAYLQSKEVPREYLSQMRHNVWVTGAEFAIFQSYDPRFPKSMQVFRTRIDRKDLDIEGHERTVLQFLLEVERDQRAMREQFGV